MPYEKLKSDILLARDQRHEALTSLSSSLMQGAVIQLALNIPGADKRPAGSSELLFWAARQLETRVPQLALEYFDVDALGPWMIYQSTCEAEQVKRIACVLEEQYDFARLIDIDVFNQHGLACDRQTLGLAQRRCLICASPAKECMRAGKHNFAQLKGRCEQLLSSFRTETAVRLPA